MELKNIMERFIQQIKDRTEYFDDNFLCRTQKCGKQHMLTTGYDISLISAYENRYRVKFIDFVIRNSLS
jgi:hypothetical protein